jgi:hypothetical protein
LDDVARRVTANLQLVDPETAERAGLTELTRTRLDPGVDGEIPSVDTHPSVVEAKERGRAAEDEIAELDARLAELRAKRPARLLMKIQNWIVAQPPGTLEMYEGPVDVPKTKDIAAAIEQTRGKIAGIRADLKAVHDAPLPSSAVRQKVRDEIAALAERGAVDVLPTIEAGLPLQWPRIDVRDQIYGQTAAGEQILPFAGFSSRTEIDVPAVLAYCLGDVLDSENRCRHCRAR